MDLGVNDKVALVAAASKGLGKASAMALAQEGASLAICARGDDELEATAGELKAAGASDVFSMVANVAKAEDVDAFVGAALEHYSKVDILFTNSGGPAPGYFWDIDDDEWMEAVELLLMSTVRLIRGVLPGMRERGWGRIICNTSIAAVQPIESLLLSNAGRAGVHGLAKTLAANVAQEGITVNCVAPGPFQTDRIENLSKARAEREGHQSGGVAGDLGRRYRYEADWQGGGVWRGGGLSGVGAGEFHYGGDVAGGWGAYAGLL